MERTVYALGFFDGVHLGHQALLCRTRELAREIGAKAGVLTFDAHPDALVLGQTPRLLYTTETRARLLQQAGMERICSLVFDRALMDTPWEDFLHSMITRFGAAGLVCGADFRFGRGGEGTATLLQKACDRENLVCAVIPPQTLDGTVISSTYIRTLVEAGDMETASRALGRIYTLSGTVVHGQHLGRTWGIPTANLALPGSSVCPRKGVYACKASFDGMETLAVTNIGTRPTVNGDGLTVEAWLPDFSGDLYGKTLTLSLYHHLRDEKKFASCADLQAEIRKNAAQTRKLLENT